MSEKSKYQRQKGDDSTPLTKKSKPGKSRPKAESSLPLPSRPTLSLLQFLASRALLFAGVTPGAPHSPGSFFTQLCPLGGDGLTQMKPQMCVQASSPQRAMPIWTQEWRPLQGLNAGGGEALRSAPAMRVSWLEGTSSNPMHTCLISNTN